MMSINPNNLPPRGQERGTATPFCDDMGGAVTGENAGIRELPLVDPSHLSARTLGDIAALRSRQIDKGHTPQMDRHHGDLYFKHGCDHFFTKARNARSPEKRRKHLITAATLLVALIDTEDFQKEEETSDAS